MWVQGTCRCGYGAHVGVGMGTCRCGYGIYVGEGMEYI